MDEHLKEVRIPSATERDERADATNAPRDAASRAWAACILAGVAGALIGFGLGEASYDAFQPASVKQQLGPGASDRPSLATRQEATIKNSALAYAEWGAALGLAMAIAGGLVRGPAGRPGLGAVVGAVAGGLAGAALPLLVIPIASRARFDLGIDPTVAGCLAQVAMWSLIVAAAAAGFGLAAGGGRAVPWAVGVAMLGAAGGWLIYGGAAMFFFPLAETDQPLALAWQPRLLARMLPTLGAAALLAAKWPRAARQAS